MAPNRGLEQDQPSALPDEEILRANAYALLAGLLARPPEPERLTALAALSGDSSPIGAAFTALGARAKTATAAAVRGEFAALFIGLSGGELSPYASYYRTGFLNEKPLARVRADMVLLGITRAEDVHEPEDHIAALLEMMAGLILGTFGPAGALAEQRRFFDDHLAPWAARFFADLEAAAAADFYGCVGTLGRCFIDIETQAFALAD